jgi:hypothetical protein
VNENKIELMRAEDAYANVLALLLVLKANPTHILRRAELKQGEVTAEPLDFIADFHLKSKRALSSVHYELLVRLVNNGTPEILPTNLKQSLGRQFIKSKMDISGDYRVLYFRAKNNQLYDRDEPQHFPEAVEELQ